MSICIEYFNLLIQSSFTNNTTSSSIFKKKIIMKSTFTTWGSNGNEDGKFGSPTGITVSSNGIVYVSDTYNDRIQCFTSDGKFICKFGSRGTCNGQFSSPRGLAIGISSIMNDSIMNAMRSILRIYYPYVFHIVVLNISM